MSVDNSRYLSIGPGGRRCQCCFPAPGSKDRRAQFRIAKRKAERAAMIEANNDLIDHEAMIDEEIKAVAAFDEAYGDEYDYLLEEREAEFEDEMQMTTLASTCTPRQYGDSYYDDYY